MPSPEGDRQPPQPPETPEARLNDPLALYIADIKKIEIDHDVQEAAWQTLFANKSALQELEDNPQISAAERQELEERAEQARQAHHTLVEQFLPHVVGYTRRYQFRRTMDRLDIIQEGNDLLNEAVWRYDGRGYFAPYLNLVLWTNLPRRISRQGYAVRLPARVESEDWRKSGSVPQYLSLDEAAGRRYHGKSQPQLLGETVAADQEDTDVSGIKAAAKDTLDTLLEEAILSLDPTIQEALLRYFEIGQTYGEDAATETPTLREIADDLNITEGGVRYRIRKGLDAIRSNPEAMEQLHAALEDFDIDTTTEPPTDA